MKKFLSLLLVFTLSFSVALFSACSPTEPASVTLFGLAGATAVSPSSDYDYFVVPEPAATTKVNASQGQLSFAGSLQSLYGDGQGYPQAVLVAKKSVMQSNGAKVKQVIDSFAQNKAWLLDEETQPVQIVNAVQSGFISQMTPTFTANNLNKNVLENCGVNFTSAQNAKNSVLNYLSKINAVSNNSFGTPVDEFFYNGSCSDTVGGQLTLYCPDGAPALSVARLLADNTIIDGLQINVVLANVIQQYVTGANPTADLCILPVNAASKILGNANNYQMLGVVTNGNLFLLSKQGAQSVTRQNAKTVLDGKKIGVINLANVPGLTLKAILNDLDVQFTEPA